VADVPGTCVYTPPAGTVLPVGNGQALSVLFTPANPADYTNASAATTIDVTASPAAPAAANLVVTYTLTRSNTAINVVLKIANTGGTAAANVTLTSAKIGTTPGAPLPQTVGTIAAGSSVQASVAVPLSAGAAGAASSLSVAGTYTGGTFGTAARVTLP
jgi:hypothetical protein